LAWIELGSAADAAAVSSGHHPARLGLALERLDAALEIAPDDLAVRLTRGLVLLRASRPERARADLEAARARPALAYSSTYGLAKLALANGRDDEALDLATQACALDAARP